MNFLDFINAKNERIKNTQYLLEGFKNEDFKKVFGLIRNLLQKNIDSHVIIDSAPTELKIGGQEFQSYFIYFSDDKKKFPTKAITINYRTNAKTFDPYSITFYDKDQISKLLWNDDNTPVKASLDINFMGASIVYYLPVIYHIINTGDYSLSETKIKDLAGKVYNKKLKESYHNFYIGALNYHVYENIDDNKLFDIFSIKSNIALNNGFDSIQNYIFHENELEDKKKEFLDRRKQAQREGDVEAERHFYKQYRMILDAIKGGATSIDELEMSIQKKLDVSIDNKELEKTEKEFKKKTKDPEIAFKQMHSYINAVIKGLQPGCILCGAPGIGKTYRVLTQLKAKGYVNGQNLDIIKGKCTPRQLYLSMYEHKDKGHIIVIDDADALVGPKAPEDVINILKGALDSTTDDEGGRNVSYRVSGDLKDNEGIPVPKTMSYAGSVIVITNYTVAELDSALKSRVFTQTLDFTTEQLLKIIKEIMPAIEPNRISPKAKIQAYEYLSELAEKGTDMEISIRSFGTCARIFQLGEDPENDLSIDDIKDMIEEQMSNMARQRKRKNY